MKEFDVEEDIRKAEAKIRAKNIKFTEHMIWFHLILLAIFIVFYAFLLPKMSSVIFEAIWLMGYTGIVVMYSYWLGASVEKWRHLNEHGS